MSHKPSIASLSSLRRAGSGKPKVIVRIRRALLDLGAPSTLHDYYSGRRPGFRIGLYATRSTTGDGGPSCAGSRDARLRRCEARRDDGIGTRSSPSSLASGSRALLWSSLGSRNRQCGVGIGLRADRPRGRRGTRRTRGRQVPREAPGRQQRSHQRLAGAALERVPPRSSRSSPPGASGEPGWKAGATDLIHERCPVGAGPSSKDVTEMARASAAHGRCRRPR